MLSVILLSVMALDRSLPFQQIPAKGSSRINIYVRKKFYITGPWKGSECRNAEGHYADCRGAGLEPMISADSHNKVQPNQLLCP